MSDPSPEAAPTGDVRARLGQALRDALKAERHAAAAQYDQAGHADRAARLRQEAEVLSSAAARR